MSAKRMNELLKGADGLPPHLRDWLRDGFTAYQQGEDLADSLELHRPGLDERDEWIQLAIGLCPGESDSSKCAFLVDCLAGRQQHPETTGRYLVEKLISSPVKVHLSIKQLLRILDGRRQDGWRVQGT